MTTQELEQSNSLLREQSNLLREEQELLKQELSEFRQILAEANIRIVRDVQEYFASMDWKYPVEIFDFEHRLN